MSLLACSRQTRDRHGPWSVRPDAGSDAGRSPAERRPIVRAGSARLPVLALAAILSFSSLARAEIFDDRSFRMRLSSATSSAAAVNAIVGRGTASYLIAAEAGRQMKVDLRSTNASAHFNVYAPGRRPGDAALIRSDIVGAGVSRINSASFSLPQSGDYTVQVFLNRNAARRGEVAAFTLSVSVTGKAGAATQLPETPGTSAGNPAYWRVSGLASGGHLNMRSGPSTANTVIGTLRQGEIVRNLGCTAGGSAWCQVSSTENGRTGWASARYLVAGQRPASGTVTQLPGATPLPPDRFSATGQLACTIDNRTAQCPWGVIRRGGGRSTLVVTLPRGGERRIEFDGEIPFSANRAGGVLGEYLPNRMIVVTVGANERYQLAVSALTGS